jgi:hypothetical protein
MKAASASSVRRGAALCAALLCGLWPWWSAATQELAPLGGPSPEPLFPTDDTGEPPPRGELPGLRGEGRRGGEAAPWLDLTAGLTFIKRSYTLSSLDAGLALDSSFYNSVQVEGAVFPLSGRPGWWSEFGLSASFLRGVDTTVAMEGDVVRNIISRHSELGVMLLWRVKLQEALWVRADAGFYLLDFVLSDNPFYSSTTYRAWRLGAQAEYQALPWLRAEAELGLLPLVGLGASEAEFGEGSSSLGAVAGVGAEVDLIGRLYLRGGYRLRWFSTSFEGRGLRGLEAVVTTDFFHDLSLWAGFRL